MREVLPGEQAYFHHKAELTGGSMVEGGCRIPGSEEGADEEGMEGP